MRLERGEFLPKFAAWLVALVLVALPIVALVQGWFGAERFPLRQLELEGRFERVSAEQVQDAVKPEAGAGFFAVRLDRIRGALERLPVVARVDVRKRWPDVVSVRIEERIAVATFGADRLVDAQGVVFGPLRPELDAGLPQLAGPDAAAAAMLEELALGRSALEPVGLAPVGLEMSARGGVRLALSSGASVELGRDEHEQRLQRFTTAWPRVPTPAGMELGRADLRYANGFAIEWRAVPPPPAPPPAAPIESAPIESAPIEPAPTEPAPQPSSTDEAPTPERPNA